MDHLGIKERINIEVELNNVSNYSKNKFWCVRAGRGGGMLNKFKEEGFIAIDFVGTAPKSLESISREELKLSEVSGNAVGQLITFRDLIQIGDYILTAEPGSQRYAIFKILSNYYFEESEYGFSHRRNVEFIKSVDKSDLSEELVRSLRTILTVFKPSSTNVLDKIID